MREIKFRAWDCKDKIMWCPLTIEDLIISGWEMKDIDGSNSLPHSDYVVFDAHKDTVWMQYTGLKDKNGKEIYEGDIVKVKGTKRVGGYITTIVWNHQGWELKENNTYLVDNRTLISIAIEVIGNIYENHELLNQTK